MTCPDTKPAPSLTRNDAVWAISSGRPTRWTGIWAAAAFWKSSNPTPTRAAVAAVISVTMKPGSMALAVTPNLPSSNARAWVNPRMPALLTTTVGPPSDPASCSTAAVTEASSDTSAPRATAFPPASVMAWTVSAQWAASRSRTPTASPSAARRLATAAPIPRAAPETTATLSAMVIDPPSAVRTGPVHYAAYEPESRYQFTTAELRRPGRPGGASSSALAHQSVTVGGPCALVGGRIAGGAVVVDGGRDVVRAGPAVAAAPLQAQQGAAVGRGADECGLCSGARLALDDADRRGGGRGGRGRGGRCGGGRRGRRCERGALRRRRGRIGLCLRRDLHLEWIVRQRHSGQHQQPRDGHHLRDAHHQREERHDAPARMAEGDEPEYDRHREQSQQRADQGHDRIRIDDRRHLDPQPPGTSAARRLVRFVVRFRRGRAPPHGAGV